MVYSHCCRLVDATGLPDSQTPWKLPFLYFKLLLLVICYMLYVISGMLFWYMLFVLPVVCRLLRRCWLLSRKNFAALKKFGVCDNKHFDFEIWLKDTQLEH